VPELLYESAGHTSTQVGALGELIASAGIIHASNGQLSPFRPIADDDGLDLLVLNKQTRKALPLQIKCRRRFDDQTAQTVQFDVRLKTLVATADGHVLYIRLEGLEAKTFWLVPASDLHDKRERKGTFLSSSHQPRRPRRTGFPAID
jgi:hypothetical protein